MRRKITFIISASLFAFYGCNKKEDIKPEEVQLPTEKKISDFALPLYDANRNGVLDASEIEHIEEIDCSGQNISSLEGIEMFIGLKTLKASNNKITHFTYSLPKLKVLELDNNLLTKLDFSTSGTKNKVAAYEFYLSTTNNPDLKCIKLNATQMVGVRGFSSNWKKDDTAQYNTHICN